ncbi:hypothetical protein J2X20_003286 [Pelomonas saccharophila]|uniref:DUF4157 domain-containing protein n=1 Tax=Roseateles saccharophilus TaxID=304 RepID=A0ABU1YPG6_ROSSA|nr:hypothetical protein [Roseateles saccharophilus]MDR7270628.1 hypothetical protein [Roseateles saccharophilus]
MNEALAGLLPTIMPSAIEWAQQCELHIGRFGDLLNEAGIELARRVGVSKVERVRILLVDAIPIPSDPALQRAIRLEEFLGPDTSGLTLGYGIFIRRGKASARLVSHELRHVHQYEQAGSIARFLPLYLEDVAQVGYYNSRYEVDARAHEHSR